MAEALLPRTRSGALDLLAERLRKHYGERLRALYALYALDDDPYEPQAEPRALHVLVVLPEVGYDRSNAQREITRIGAAFDRALDYRFVAMPKVVSEADVQKRATGAARAAADGVLL